MYRKNARRGLSRTDLIACLILCLLLLLFVPPLFSGSQKRAERVFCRSNLAQIGKLMFVYANDYDDALPRAGGPTTEWSPTPNWMGTSRYTAFGITADLTGGRASISASLYLLVKYVEAPPRLFVCKADKGTTEFRMDELSVFLPATFELVDAWDFGPPVEAWKHNSYAYHTPYTLYFLTRSRDPNMAVLADRNPWIRSPGADASYYGDFQPDIPPWSGSGESARAGNAIAHERDGQNVLFLDGRATFETRAFCGAHSDTALPYYGRVQWKDNIYTVSLEPTRGHPMGTAPVATPGLCPGNRLDSVLVHDPNTFGPDPGPPRRR